MGTVSFIDIFMKSWNVCVVIVVSKRAVQQELETV